MNQVKNYRCLSFSPFNFIRILIYGFVIIYILNRLFILDVKTALWNSVGIVITLELFYLLSSYTSVSFDGEFLKINSFRKKIRISNLVNYTTWWSYNFGASTPELGESGMGKSNPTANKINCFVKFTSQSESVYIYEEIHLGQKFPNNIQYKPNETIDKSKLIKVWDVDKCLEKLQIFQYEKE